MINRNLLRRFCDRLGFRAHNKLSTRSQKIKNPSIRQNNDVRRVLITGAAGEVAGYLRPLLACEFPSLRLTDREQIDDLEERVDFVRVDLTNLDDVFSAMRNVDGVVHLGAIAKQRPFDEILSSNIIGTYNVFEAARRQGIERIVLASTMHVMGYYDRCEGFAEIDPMRPDSLYAVSKIYAEALGRLYATKYGLRVACLRIGHLAPTLEQAEPGNWISPQDLAQLVRIGLEHPDLHFEIFHAVADYPGAPWGNSRALSYGYRCQHPAERYTSALDRAADMWPDDQVARAMRGATFASQDHSLG